MELGHLLTRSGLTDTKWIKEWNNAFDRTPLTQLQGRKGRTDRQESYMTDIGNWGSTS
jgi:hypothetical protein